MSQVLVVGEDALCCAVGEKLVDAALPGWSLARESVNTRGITKLVPRLPDFIQQARHVQPVICIADTDRSCPVNLIANWMAQGGDERFVLRLAVKEAESWLLSDPESFSSFLNVPVVKLPKRPDEEPDPKQVVLNLASNSKSRQIRTEVVSTRDKSRPGPGYNLHLCHFVKAKWRVSEARTRSPSLNRAVNRVAMLEA